MILPTNNLQKLDSTRQNLSFKKICTCTLLFLGVVPAILNILLLRRDTNLIKTWETGINLAENPRNVTSVTPLAPLLSEFCTTPIDNTSTCQEIFHASFRGGVGKKLDTYAKLVYRLALEKGLSEGRFQEADYLQFLLTYGFEKKIEPEVLARVIVEIDRRFPSSLNLYLNLMNFEPLLDLLESGVTFEEFLDVLNHHITENGVFEAPYPMISESYIKLKDAGVWSSLKDAGIPLLQAATLYPESYIALIKEGIIPEEGIKKGDKLLNRFYSENLKFDKEISRLIKCGYSVEELSVIAEYASYHFFDGLFGEEGIVEKLIDYKIKNINLIPFKGNLKVLQEPEIVYKLLDLGLNFERFDEYCIRNIFLNHENVEKLIENGFSFDSSDLADINLALDVPDLFIELNNNQLSWKEFGEYSRKFRFSMPWKTSGEDTLRLAAKAFIDLKKAGILFEDFKDINIFQDPKSFSEALKALKKAEIPFSDISHVLDIYLNRFSMRMGGSGLNTYVENVIRLHKNKISIKLFEGLREDDIFKIIAEKTDELIQLQATHHIRIGVIFKIFGEDSLEGLNHPQKLIEWRQEGFLKVLLDALEGKTIRRDQIIDALKSKKGMRSLRNTLLGGEL